MQKLYMSDEEIARSYCGTMNKDAQIGILAELNAGNRTVMRNKLVALGLVQGKIEPIPEPKKPAIERIDMEEAADAIENGRAHAWFESRWPDFELHAQRDQPRRVHTLRDAKTAGKERDAA